MLNTLVRKFLFLSVGIVLLPLRADADEIPLQAGWKTNGLAETRYVITGTESRNNPLRRQLETPFTGEELYLRYRIRYDAKTLDTPLQDEGEFFVFWLDEQEGTDGSTHSGNVPNIGIHVANDENHFMARYTSSREKHADVLEGDRDYLIVARLWKSKPGADQPFDQLNLWVDPVADDELSPDATISQKNAITTIAAVGFSTGAKTEYGDRIEVWDMGLSDSWREILKLPPQEETTSVPEVMVAEKTVHFEKDIYPILKSRCFSCHTGAEPESGVRLDVLDEVLNQTAPRNADNSQLIKLIVEGEMPPEGDPVTDEELIALKTWIDEGLDWDEQLLPTPTPQTDHWAFQPIARPEIPDVLNKSWIQTPVDAFIAARHEEQNLSPNPPADPLTLRRRLSLDLRGLPPEPDTGKPLEQIIEQHLNDRAYGERWGRHWLDIARWAESNGHQHNRMRPYAWRYRDWVIDAFHSNKPFDEFLRAQIAGDELTPFDPDNIIATGFLSSARYSGNELDKEIQRNDILVDLVNTTSKAFLGITMECAQCHTHKFDPLTIRDYYRMQAFFTQGQPGNVVIAEQREEAKQLIAERWRIFDNVHHRMVEVRRRQGVPEPIYVIPKSVERGMRADEKARYNQLNQQIAELEQSWSFYSPISAGTDLPVAPHEMRWPLPREKSSLENRQTMLLVRGDPMSKGPTVDPGWPAVFGSTPENLVQPRTALADWMTSSDNPLTARVWVNRIWQWHFGRGIVETSSDLGTQGAKPTHPELLDWLASELIDSDWNTNHIHRLILHSATYQQSSQSSPRNAEIDPENKWYWKWAPRRLEAEAIRDSMLVVSGQLETFAGGPSRPEDAHCRSVYLRQKRADLPDQQLLFDSAQGIVSCARRRVSTSPLQPLWLLNSEFAQQAADRLAQHAGSLEEAVQLTFGRPATDVEMQLLQSLADEYGLTSACLTLLNAHEFLYIP
ncbi:MAG: DUF1553 domain-containing protein [Planctomycetaceae bacterium]|nr:DUF1553 domain-containing protein [Planctomycetaceae bacterium]